MKRKLSLPITCILALAFCLFKCKKDSRDAWPDASHSAKPLSVNSTHAAEVASSYAEFFRENGTPGRNLRGNATTDTVYRKISRIRTLKDEEGVDLMHIIDYVGKHNESRGFMIIAADRRVTPILAKGDSGTFNPDNPGPEIWIAHVMDQVRQGKQEITRPEPDIEALWLDLERRADIRMGRISGSADPQLPPGRNCPDDWDAFVPPILQTSWGQGIGYNRYCPSRSCATPLDCNNAPAGCGAVAIAQVWNASTLQKPTHYTVPPAGPQPIAYPLANLSSSSCNSNNSKDMMIASLIRVAGMWAGSNYNFLGCNTLTWRENIKDAFVAAGYSKPGSRVAWTTYENNALSELSFGYPAIIDGTKGTDDISQFHIWVVDGIQAVNHYVEPEDPYAQCIETRIRLYHLNWGWYGQDNNYYVLGNFMGSALNYKSYLHTTYGFRPYILYVKNPFRFLFLVTFLMVIMVSCDGCRKDEYEVFNRVFPRCDACTAVRMYNRRTKVETVYDEKLVQTLRNVNDSLIIKLNGAVVSVLPNFKQVAADRKHRKYYFQSISGSKISTIRFQLTNSAATPLVTSLIMEGEYSPFTDTVDVFYQQN